MQLVEGEEPLAHRPLGRHCGGDGYPPAIGLEGRRAVGRHRPPVVPDDHGVPVATEGLVESAGVEGERSGVVAAVLGHRRGRVPAQVGRHGAVPGVGQAGEQVAPGVGGVREAVQAQGQRPVLRAFAQAGELDAVGLHRALIHVPEGTSGSGRRRG